MSARDTRRKDKYIRGKDHGHKRQSTKNHELVEVWLNTVEHCKQNYSDVIGYKIDTSDYLSEDSSEEDSSEEDSSEEDSSEENIDVGDVRFGSKLDTKSLSDSHPITFPCQVECVNSDTLDLALVYAETYDSVCVLNMASPSVPGGGVVRGRTAQEEEIFRRTNAFMGHHTSFYPLNEMDVIYCPKIDILRSGPNSKYAPCEPVRISTIACPAIRQPHLYRGRYKPDDLELMTNKITGLIKLAIEKGHDCLVLGALGCGVYRNPPEQVAQIFATALSTYGASFKKVGFAILDHMASEKKRKFDNLRIFRQYLLNDQDKDLTSSRDKQKLPIDVCGTCRKTSTN